jgi:hypothetical protein
MAPAITKASALTAAFALILIVGTYGIPRVDAAESIIQTAVPTAIQEDRPMENEKVADGPFQVTIEVFELVEGKPEQLQDRHLVLFQDGKAYDFSLFQPRVVTVIDPAESTVTLLSREKHVQSTIAHQDMVAVAARVRLFAKNQGIEDRLGINAKAKPVAADEGDDDQTASYQVSFAGYHYDATTEQPSMAMQAARFAEFTDWVARVNLYRKIGTPPFARISLGREIANEGLVPSTIHLRLTSENHSRTFLSRYTFKDSLSESSKKRIDEVAGMVSLYQEVPLESFPKQ